MTPEIFIGLNALAGVYTYGHCARPAGGTRSSVTDNQITLTSELDHRSPMLLENHRDG